MSRLTMLRRLRASPYRAGVGFGLVALPLWVGLEYVLFALDPQGVWYPAVWVCLLVALGFLTALIIPGRSGWKGYLIGGLTIATVAGVFSAIFPAPPQAGIPRAEGVAAVVVWALAGGFVILFSSAGYPIAMVVQRLRRPAPATDP